MKKRILPIITAFVLAFILVMTPAVSMADFGDFSGDSDWGGDFNWGGDWDSDWGNPMGGGFLFFGDWGGGSLIGVFFILMVIFIFVRAFMKKHQGGPDGFSPSQTREGSVNLNPIAGLRLIDPQFSEDAMKEKISNLYVQMQQCWQNKDLSPLESSMTGAFYSQSARQLEPYIKNQQTNRIERIAVLGVDLLGYTADQVNTTLTARVHARIVDYTVDDRTGQTIRGSRTKERFMVYEWSLIRKNGITTRIDDKAGAVYCTSCGAPMNVNASAKCEYCGTVIKNPEYDWVISGIRGISQRTG